MTTRLHISPFSPDLLPSVLPPSLQAVAENVSFHQIVTFPENNYGYVTLPTMEADKIKKKLNGSILKGKKFRVEAARPDKHEEEKAEKKEKKKDKKERKEKKEKKEDKKEEKSRKRKADDHCVVDGYELPADRKVKRGWTESTEAKEDRRKEEKRKRKEDKKAKSQLKSKYTEKDECLFRAQLPPNSKPDKNESNDKKKKQHKSPKEPVVVHEFANTVSHPSFLRSATDDTAPTSAFEQEKGWVDGEGHVKEPASDRATKPDYRPGKVPGVKEKPKPKPVYSAKESESEESDWTSSSGSDGDSDSDSESGSESESEESKPAPAHNKDDNKDDSKDDSKDNNEAEDGKENGKEEAPNQVHPLEAVFKRPTAGADVDTTENPHFSFFDADDIESDNDNDKDTQTLAEPQTPFTARDLQSRGLRSAAPTPDTNQVGRTVKWSNNSGDEMDVDDDRDEDEDDDDSVSTPASKSIDETEFTRWFWENRGDNNRAWKRRRREAAKEERQRENRRKGMKGKS